MSTISSASTVAQIEAAYLDNASYVEDNSTTKAAAFITACRALLIRLPSTATKGANTLSYNTDNLKEELARAQAWLEARNADARPGPSATRADFRRSRE